MFMAERGYRDVDEIPPDDFVTWVFPRLFHARLPRYEAIAREWGYTVEASALGSVADEADFIELVCRALANPNA